MRTGHWVRCLATRKPEMFSAAIKRFYSWHFSIPVGAARFAVVVYDSLAGAMVAGVVCMGGISILLLFFGGSPVHWLLGSALLSLISPLFAWQIVIVSASRVTIVRALLVVPYWVTRIPPGTEAELYEAYEDTSPSAVAYKLGNDYVYIGNGWNAQSVLDLLRSRQALCSAAK